MNWKEEALQRLTDYKPMCASVCNIRTELKRLEMEAVSVSSGIQQFSSGRGCQEDRQLNNLIRRQELKQALEWAMLWVDATDRALSCLSQEEKQLLERMYILGDWGNVTHLSQELGLERSTIYRRRDEALRKFTVALYGKC